MIKEVSFIAMLHHRYIVRYYNAWVEVSSAFVAAHAVFTRCDTLC